jgi:hypothetical protein
VSRLDELRIAVRRLAARVAVLEAAGAPKPKPAPSKPGDAEVMETRRLWDEYHDVAEKVYGRGSQRASKSAFAKRHHFPEREFRRAFSSVDKRGLRPGSALLVRIRDELREATATLKQTPGNTHGNLAAVYRRTLKTAV